LLAEVLIAIWTTLRSHIAVVLHVATTHPFHLLGAHPCSLMGSTALIMIEAEVISAVGNALRVHKF
jgi:hypothetical protein